MKLERSQMFYKFWISRKKLVFWAPDVLDLR